MNNEVVIHVKVDNDAKGGLTAAKTDVDKFGKDAAKSALAAGADIGKNLGKTIGGGLSSAAEAAGPMVASAVALGIAASPLIGATLSAAVIGGAGLGGVVGGLVIASKDPRVKAAFTGTADTIKTQLTEAASSFVEPAIAGIHVVGNAVKNIDFKSIFADSSKFVAPLASGVGALISGIGDGLKNLIANAGPVIDAISHGVGDLGGVLREAFGDLAKNGDTAADAMSAIFDIINSTIGATFEFINALTQVYGVLEKIPGVTTPINLLHAAMMDATGTAQNFGAALPDAVNAMLGIGQAGTTSADGVISLQEALDNLTNSAKTLFDDTTNVGKAIDNITKAAKENKKGLDESTESGRNNRKAVSDLAKALREQYTATLDVNGAGPVTDAVATKNRGTFIRLATAITGSKTEAIKLANSILGIPEKHDTKIHADPEPAITAARRAKGAIGNVPNSKTTSLYANTHDAEGRLSYLQGRINAIHGKTVQMTIAYNYKTFGKPGTGGGLAHGGIKGAASGAMSSDLTWVGENGPELLDLPPGTRVNSNPDSTRMAAQAAGGGGQTVLAFQRSGDAVLDDLFQFLLTKMQATNRKRYGNSAERMFAG